MGGFLPLFFEPQISTNLHKSFNWTLSSPKIFCSWYSLICTNDSFAVGLRPVAGAWDCNEEDACAAGKV